MISLKPARPEHLLLEGARILRNSSASTPMLDAEILLAYSLGMERTALLLQPPGNVSESLVSNFRELVRRRSNGEPVAYITGKKDFYNATFIVNRSVLIPRPETEELVETILKRFPGEPSMTLCDIGTGSGCIALSLAIERKNWKITATDISPEALAVARKNAGMLKVNNVDFIESDLLSATDEKFDVIVANPPYIDTAARSSLSPDVREFEPETALFAENGGLSVIGRIAGETPRCMKRGGSLFMEIGHDQKDGVRDLLSGHGWENIEFIRDISGHARIAAATCSGERGN